MSFIILLWVIAIVLFLITTMFDSGSLISLFSGIGFVVILIPSIASTYSWQSSGSKAKIINETYNTHYIKEDIFWNGDFIEKQLMANNSIVTDSKNSNINLNIKTDRKEQKNIIVPIK